MFYTNKRFIKLFKIILIFMAIVFIGKSLINYTFPIKYESILDKYIQKYSLDKDLVFAVINTESRFKKDAVSSKGAIGLMQIMPETGQWLSEKIGLEDFDTNDLYNIETNVELGCFYLSYLFDKFKDEKLALCAYNAGATNVYRWLEDEQYSTDGNIHTIPFKETDKYIKKINLLKTGYHILFKIKATTKTIV